MNTKLALVGSLFLASCVPGRPPAFTDRTQAVAPYADPMNEQTFEADVVATGDRRLQNVSVEFGGRSWPMANDSGSQFVLRTLVPACEQVLTYRYFVEYESDGDLKDGDSWVFPETGSYTRSFTNLPPSCATMPTTGGRVFIVTTLFDSVDSSPGDGVCASSGGGCSLRAAVMEANASPTRDVILLPGGRHRLTLTGSEAVTAADPAISDLDITQSVVISGPCPADIRGFLDPTTLPPYADLPSSSYSSIDAGGTSRVLDIQPASTAVEVALRCLHVTGGALLNSATALNDRWEGAGIYNRATLTLEKVAVTHNRQQGITSGTGIHNDGNLVLRDSALLHNRGDAQGQAFGGTSGGGLFSNTGNVTIERSTIAFNEAARGSAIQDFGTLTIVNSTFTDNAASNSGGVFASVNQQGGHLRASWSTFVSRGGVPISQFQADAGVANSIILGTCSGDVPGSLGGNWVTDAACLNGVHSTLDVVQTNPIPTVLRDKLESRGGFTPTLRIRFLAGDDPTQFPIDRPTIALFPCPPVDQRGFSRPFDVDSNGVSACDLGALELRPNDP